jgi:uncharacterized protein
VKTKEIIVVGILFLLAVGFTYYYQTNSEQESRDIGTDEVCFKNDCFIVEIADDESERTLGLMDRADLDSGKGMLFIWKEEGIYPFWMKNTLISLDMIWISSHGKVVFIYKNAEPLSLQAINPGVKAKYVLEVNAGKAEDLDLKVGNVVDINLLEE